jgi:hypothetical protein
MLEHNFTVYNFDGTGAYALSVPPVAWDFTYPILDDTPDGGVIQSAEASVAWQFSSNLLTSPTDADYAAIVARRSADGSIRFRTLNDADQVVVCTGKIDPYLGRVRVRGHLPGLRVEFRRVIVIG